MRWVQVMGALWGLRGLVLGGAAVAEGSCFSTLFFFSSG